ncbi:conserved hypothetical protein [Gloeothece citriformis PCC 7424]|uniref:DUF2605 domain-containing protein n=1 Tax=Gloeothece citriformis (strain PCC 7424) TaxID=65393 RepID=B7K7Q7_GLOC7|nr:DUF2605 domain-containing protein [Gloeothece citriformis]ACK69825.1 conserved hypothetical protein [Gloeothece citriformis PCC 7424]
MSNSQPSERELLNTVLKPLLEDFQYWFSRACTLLEKEPLSFLSPEEQSNLLQRVKQAQQEVTAAQMIFQATDGQAGIEASMLVPWHKLVAECWQVSMRLRSLKQEQG